MRVFIEGRLKGSQMLALGPGTGDSVPAVSDADSNDDFVLVEEAATDEPLIEEPEALEAMHGILSSARDGSEDERRLERRLQHELSLVEVTQRHAWLRTNFEQVQAERRHREMYVVSSMHACSRCLM